MRVACPLASPPRSGFSSFSNAKGSRFRRNKRREKNRNYWSASASVTRCTLPETGYSHFAGQAEASQLCYR